ncbi:MAG: hypothetical protein OEZ39_05485 [Gammaproteobacteria bacterium]|nr:hypothetical protein [Gammaproteobacteria bacterium]
MALTEKQLFTELYQEHLTETGSLLSFTHAYFTDPEILWPEVYELEQRIEAHVDALELGGKLAYQCSLEYLASDDEDELLGAVYSLATIKTNNHRLSAVLKAIVEASEESLPSFVMALGHGGHPLISETLIPLLAHDRPLIRSACKSILCYRHDVDPKKIWPYLHHADTDIRSHTLAIYAALSATETLPAAEQWFFDRSHSGDGADIAEHDLIALMQLGSERAMALCRDRCKTEEGVTAALLTQLALAGRHNDLNLIYNAAALPNMALPSLQALGILGDARVVPALIKALLNNDDEIKQATAEALALITGAGLQETVELPDEEIEELEPEEITGESTAQADKETQQTPARTIKVTRPSQSFELWTKWWQAHHKHFAPEVRWRHGRPFSPQSCLMELNDPQSPFELRQQAYRAMQLLGCRTPFEPDWLVTRQLKAIMSMKHTYQITESAAQSSSHTKQEELATV